MSPAMTNAAITLTTEVENLVGTLCQLLDRETDAVQSSDFDIFREVQNDKFSMLTRYRSLMDTLQRQSDGFSRVDPVVIERLRKISTKFSDTAERNSQTLEAGSKSMQRIVDRIVRSARDTVHGNRQTYNKQGHTGTNIQSPLSIQVDEIL